MGAGATPSTSTRGTEPDKGTPRAGATLSLIDAQTKTRLEADGGRNSAPPSSPTQEAAGARCTKDGLSSAMRLQPLRSAAPKAGGGALPRPTPVQGELLA